MFNKLFKERREFYAEEKSIDSSTDGSLGFWHRGIGNGTRHTHEHSHIFEPAVAHAETLPKTLWKCYFCGYTVYNLQYMGLGADMRSMEERTIGRQPV